MRNFVSSAFLFAATFLLVTRSGCVHARLGEETPVSSAVAESAVRDGEPASDRVNVNHLEVQKDGPMIEGSDDGIKTEVQGVLSSAPDSRFASVATSAKTADPVSETEAAPSSAANPSSLPAAKPEFYPPPIRYAEMERPEDDISNVYLNPMQETSSPGNAEWLNGDRTAFRMSEFQRL
eukprot:g3011.t1